MVEGYGYPSVTTLARAIKAAIPNRNSRHAFSERKATMNVSSAVTKCYLA